MRTLSVLLLSFFAISCNHNNELVTRFHEDGRAKPIVSIASMIDTTSFDAPWSLSEEFTSSIIKEVAKSGQIFIQPQDELALTESPFNQDLSWMKREFPSQEFAVFMELVQHETVPALKSKKNIPLQEASTNLNVAVRLRVIDLRGATPKIVLQELVRDSYFIPKTLLPTDYSQVTWGTEDYKKSPMGVAHSQIIHEIANRVSDYVLLAKSR